MQKTYIELLLIFGMGIASFLMYILLTFIARKDMRRYNNPGLFKNILPISLASSIGIFAPIKLLSFTVGQMGLYYFSYLFEAVGYPMAFIAPLVFTMTYMESVRTPKHNQKEAVKIMYAHNVPLREIIETATNKFPRVPQERILIYPEPGNLETLCLLPHQAEYTEHEDSFSTVLHPYPSLAQAVDIAKEKDFEMKKTRMFFFRGSLHFAIAK